MGYERGRSERTGQQSDTGRQNYPHLTVRFAVGGTRGPTLTGVIRTDAT